MSYSVGVNAPGYLPDVDPTICPTWADAWLELHRQAIITAESLYSDDTHVSKLLEEWEDNTGDWYRTHMTPQNVAFQFCGLVHFIEAL